MIAEDDGDWIGSQCQAMDWAHVTFSVYKTNTPTHSSCSFSDGRHTRSITALLSIYLIN